MKVYLTDGTLPTYFDNGKKSGEVTYKNSKRHGPMTFTIFISDFS